MGFKVPDVDTESDCTNVQFEQSGDVITEYYKTKITFYGHSTSENSPNRFKISLGEPLKLPGKRTCSLQKMILMKDGIISNGRYARIENWFREQVYRI